jgi:hypothetical protein
VGHQAVLDPKQFSLTEGGPFHRLLTRLRLHTRQTFGRSIGIGILAWLPLAIGEALHMAGGAQPDPMLLDLSLHVRLLVALPILLSSETLLERASRSAIASLHAGNVLDGALLLPILARAERLRDSRVMEAVMAGVALLGGQLVLWRVLGATGAFHGGAEVSVQTFPRVWYAVVALPLFQFVLFRWLWRWLIWSYVLWRMSRLPLRILATHADHAAGLTPLARPVSAFCFLVLANACVLAGAWGTQVLGGLATIRGFLPGLVTYLLISLLVGLGPLLLYCPHLYTARRVGLADYGDLVRDYTQRFHDKWIKDPDNRDQALGSPDIQSLNDLGEAFQVVARTRFFVFSSRNVMMVWASGLIPMIPLFAGTLTTEAVLKKILGTVLGGFPL